jgi:methionyl-tRNA formyltransferase
MKIIFISGVKFGYDVLESILQNNWKIHTSFSYLPEKKKFYSDYANFENLTKKYGVNHKQVNNINDQENIELIKKINPDLILVLGWSQLLKKEIIEIPRLGVIGSHPTELPKYRGRAPIPWSILKGLRKSALTFFYIQEGIDDGDIILQEQFDINDIDDAESLYEKITILGEKMSSEILSSLESKQITGKKQNLDLFIENWPKRTPLDGRIDWSKPAKEIHNLIRATTYPYPGAYTFFKNKKLIIWKSTLDTSLDTSRIQEPGKIIIKNNQVKIGTSNGSVFLDMISYDCDENKNAIEIFSSSDNGMKLE